MKNLSKTMVGLVAVLALGACSGSSVSAEKFAEEARKVEDHTYTEAVIKYDLDLDMLIVKDQANGEVKFTYEDGEWTTDSTDEHELSLYIYLETNVREFNAADAVIEFDDVDPKDLKINYYVNPFKVTLSGNVKDSETGSKTNVKCEYKFDKYGYATYLYTDINSTLKGLDKKEYTLKMYEKINISYK